MQRLSVLAVVFCLALAGCTNAGLEAKDCGSDFGCFEGAMDSGCSPAKVVVSEQGFSALLLIRGNGSKATCRVRVSVEDLERKPGWDDEKWETVSSGLPVLKTLSMNCMLGSKTARELYDEKNLVLANETLASCNGLLLDALRETVLGAEADSPENGTKTQNQTPGEELDELDWDFFPDNLSETMDEWPDIPVPAYEESCAEPLNSWAYLWIRGETQGAIEGEVEEEGFEGAIRLESFDQDVVFSGRDPGREAYEPLGVSKLIDRASPLIMNALVSRERLELLLEIYCLDEHMEPVHYYSVELEDALVDSVKQTMSLNETGPLEEVSFTYGRITCTHETTGVSASGDSREARE